MCLGDLLRDAVQETSELQRLDKQMAWLRRYAQILEARHHGALCFRWDVAPDVHQAMLPRLLLQPLVENAVKHGALRRGDGAGEVVVRASRRDDGVLVCVIEDNGPGMPDADVRAGAFGLQAVRRRLELEAHHASLRLESSSAGHAVDRRDRRGVTKIATRAKANGTVMTSGSPLRTLVVEDEWPARNYLVELLESSQLAEVVGAVGAVDEARQALASDLPGRGARRRLRRRGAPGRRQRRERSVAGAVGGAGSRARRCSCSRRPTSSTRSRRSSSASSTTSSSRSAKSAWRSACGACTSAGRRRAGIKSGPARIVARRKRSLVFLEPPEIWAFEAADRLTFVHTMHGTFDIDLSLAAVEASFGRAFVRVHRNWLVNAMHIKELERDGHETKLFVGAGVADAGKGVRVPVARERAAAVREMLLTNATGLRRP